MAGLWDSLSSITGGLIGGRDSKNPYEKAMKQYEKYGNKAAEYQNPFYNAGTGALNNYQNYLSDMSNPSEFINNLMSGYSESPYSKYLQEQSMRAGTNAASASGLSGSTPMAQFLQENSANIASQDIDKWLQNVLGINKDYGSGLENLIGGGRNSANNLSNLYSGLGSEMGGSARGSQYYKNKQLSDILGGIFGFAGGGDESDMLAKLLPLLMG